MRDCQEKEDKYCEMLTFRLISSVTYLKQASIYTTRLGNNSEQNQNLCTIINEKQNRYAIKNLLNCIPKANRNPTPITKCRENQST